MTLTHHLYALQARLALTGPEATALLTLAGLLALGVGVRQFQAHTAPPAAALALAAPAALDTVAARSGEGVAAAPSEASAAAAPLDAAVPAVDAVALPTSGFADPPPSRGRSGAAAPVRMNLNTADAALLQRLPRIGPALAGRILAYRQAHGPFRRVEDVVNVRGIGPKTLEEMAPYLYVE